MTIAPFRLAARPSFGWLVILAITAIGNVAQADLTLTPHAISHGFTLSTFASGLPPYSGLGSPGPMGIAYTNDGKVLVTDYNDGQIYLLPSHADNQTVTPSMKIQEYGVPYAVGLAQFQSGNDWTYYMSQQTPSPPSPPGQVVEIDAAGTLIRTVVSTSDPTGMVPYPPGLPGTLHGHLFVSDPSNGNIWDVSPGPGPGPGTMTLFASSPGDGPDGLAFSPDGSTLYVALNNGGAIRAYNADPTSPSYGNQTWESPVQSGNPDGIAIGLGQLAGYAYSNFNSGEVWEFGLPGTPHAGEVNLIASGGSRGDFIAADPNVYSSGGFPTLLLTQSDRVLRLSNPNGGWFGPPTSSTSPTVLAVSEPQSSSFDRVVASPNPFENGTGVTFTLPAARDVDVTVCDVAGRLVRKFHSGYMSVGTHHLAWDGLDSGGLGTKAGIYFIRVLVAGERARSINVVRVK